MATPLTVTPPPVAETYDIEHASKACGMNPGVLRMWELRYGWPRPARLPNGYRYFTKFEVEELKRMSALVKSGLLISKLIKDGMPKWPETEAKPAERLPQTKKLPQPSNAAAVLFRDQLIDALVTRNSGRAFELMQRCAWDLKPADQVVAAWLPTLVAFEEYRIAVKPFPGQPSLLTLIRDSVKAALSRMPIDPRPLWVVPQNLADTTLSYLTALIISQRGAIARPWTWDGLPKGVTLFVSTGASAESPAYQLDNHRGHFCLLDDGKHRTVASLLSQPV